MNAPKLAVGPRPPRRLRLQGGTRLTLEASRDGKTAESLVLRIVAKIPVDNRWKVVEVDRTECADETAMWTAIATFATDRLCDLADAVELEGGPR